MSKHLSARHTNILEQIPTIYGMLVREDYYGYPKTESNIYLVDFDEQIIWHAERAMENDSFANSIYDLNKTSFKCASWNGFSFEISLKNGKLINA